MSHQYQTENIIIYEHVAKETVRYVVLIIKTVEVCIKIYQVYLD